MRSSHFCQVRRSFAHISRFVSLPVLAACALLAGCVAESRQHVASNADMASARAPGAANAPQSAPAPTSQPAPASHAAALHPAAPLTHIASSAQPASEPAASPIHPFLVASGPPLPARTIYVRVPPPPPPHEIIPPRPGRTYVWIPGHFSWTGSGYVWIGGSWIKKPPRAIGLRAGSWVHTALGWRWIEPHFEFAAQGGGDLSNDLVTHAVHED